MLHAGAANVSGRHASVGNKGCTRNSKRVSYPIPRKAFVPGVQDTRLEQVALVLLDGYCQIVL